MDDVTDRIMHFSPEAGYIPCNQDPILNFFAPLLGTVTFLYDQKSFMTRDV
jgi:hypothetical protein